MTIAEILVVLLANQGNLQARYSLAASVLNQTEMLDLELKLANTIYSIALLGPLKDCCIRSASKHTDAVLTAAKEAVREQDEKEVAEAAVSVEGK